MTTGNSAHGEVDVADEQNRSDSLNFGICHAAVAWSNTDRLDLRSAIAPAALPTIWVLKARAPMAGATRFRSFGARRQADSVYFLSGARLSRQRQFGTPTSPGPYARQVQRLKLAAGDPPPALRMTE